MADEYLDPRDFFKGLSDSWHELWDDSLSLYENTVNLINSCAFIPKKAKITPIVATYLLASQKWCKTLGILYCHGDEGSGKSTVSILANRLHGFSTTFSPDDTFSSLRNALDAQRWVDGDTKRFEKDGALLAWDNIKLSTFTRDPRVYQLLLYGYSRESERVLIATPDGDNREFFVFSSKVISTVDPIHSHPDFTELKRRLIPVHHKKWERFSPEEKKEFEGLDIKTSRVNPEQIDWDGISDNYYQFWTNRENVQNFVFYRTAITKRRGNKIQIPPTINSHQWTISVDLIATAMALGAFPSVQEAVDFFGEYWATVANVFLSDSTALEMHLKQFIEDEAMHLIESNQRLVDAGLTPYPIVLDPEKLKRKLDLLQAQGKLDLYPSQKDIGKIMYALGWRLNKEGWTEKQ